MSGATVAGDRQVLAAVKIDLKKNPEYSVWGFDAYSG